MSYLVGNGAISVLVTCRHTSSAMKSYVLSNSECFPDLGECSLLEYTSDTLVRTLPGGTLEGLGIISSFKKGMDKTKGKQHRIAALVSNCFTIKVHKNLVPLCNLFSRSTFPTSICRGKDKGIHSSSSTVLRLPATNLGPLAGSRPSPLEGIKNASTTNPLASLNCFLFSLPSQINTGP